MKEQPQHDIFEQRFNRSAEFGKFDRSLSSYRAMVFYDDPMEKPPGEQPCLLMRYDPDGNTNNQNTSVQDLKPLEGGFENFMSKGECLLDIGAGSGAAVNEMAIQNPNSQYVGMDFRYSKEAAPPTQSPNAHLVSGTWFEMPFKDAAFDRILSVYAFPYHLGKTETQERSDDDLADDAIREITRISKKGTIWRGVLSGRNQSGESWESSRLFPGLASKYGWEITVIEENDNEIFVAKLATKN